MSHFPQHIIDWGPPRLYWCMRFEAYNQIIKALATSSNFLSLLQTVVSGLALRTARNLFFTLSHTVLPTLVRPIEEKVLVGASPLLDRMRTSGMLSKSAPVTVYWANGLQVGRFYFDARGFFLTRLKQNEPWQLARAISIFSIQDIIFLEFYLYPPKILKQQSLASWKVKQVDLKPPGEETIVYRYTSLFLMAVFSSYISSKETGDELVLARKL